MRRAAVLLLVCLAARAEDDLVAQLDDPDWNVAGPAEQRLQKLPLEERLPLLRRGLRELVRPYMRWQMAYQLGLIGTRAYAAVPDLMLALYDEDDQVRFHACNALARLGPAAWRALPLLEELAREEPRAITATAALEQIGRPDEPPPDPLADATWRIAGRRLARADVTLDDAVRGLDHAHPYVRHHAAAALVRLGPTAVPALVRRLALPDPRRRRRAAGALARIEGDAAVAALIDLLQDDDRDVQRAALRGLADAPAATDALLAFLGQADVGLMAEAVAVLERARPGASHAFLRRALRDADRATRNRAVQIVCNMGARAEPLALDLAEAGHDEDPALRRAVAEGLKRIRLTAPDFAAAFDERRVDAGAATDDLVALLDGEDRIAAGQAAELLAERAEPETVPALARALRHESCYVRAMAAKALAAQGEAAVPALVDALGAQRARVRLRAMEVIQGIGPAAAAAVPALLELMRDDGPYRSDVALSTLAAIGEPAAVAIPYARQLLGDPARCLAAIDALGAFGPLAKPAVPELVEIAVSGDRWGPGNGAIRALASITGPDFGGLKEVLRRGDAQARRAVLECVSRQQLSGPGVLELLKIAAKDPDRRVGMAAGYMLDQLRSPDDMDVAALIDALARPTNRFDELAEALGRKASVEQLVALLESDNETTRRGALLALTHKGPAASDAGPAITELLQAPRDQRLHPLAVRALANVAGNAAQPALLAALRGRLSDSTRAAIERKLAQWGDAETLAAALRVPDAAVRRSVGRALAPLAPLDPELAPDLLSHFGNSRLRVREVDDLVQEMGAAVVPGLVDILASEDRSTAQRASRALQRLGEAAVPKLTDALASHDPGLRGRILEVLATTDAGRARVVESLARDPYAGVRLHALRLLRDDVFKHRDAIENALKDNDADVARAAKRTLDDLDRFERSIKPEYLRRLAGGESVYSIGNVPAAWLQQALREAALSRDPALRRRAALTLARKREYAIDALREALASGDAATRRTAADALGRAHEDAASAVPELRAALASDDPRLRGEAAEALGAIGPAAKDAAPELAALLHDDSQVLDTAVSSLLSIDATGRWVLELWRPAGPLQRNRLANALRGKRATAAPALAALARADTEPLGQRALDRLVELGPDGVAALATLLDAPVADIRIEAARRLGRIGPAAHAAVPALIAALDDADMRDEAARALGEIGHRARAALPRLRAIGATVAADLIEGRR